MTNLKLDDDDADLLMAKSKSALMRIPVARLRVIRKCHLIYCYTARLNETTHELDEGDKIKGNIPPSASVSSPHCTVPHPPSAQTATSSATNATRGPHIWLKTFFVLFFCLFCFGLAYFSTPYCNSIRKHSSMWHSSMYYISLKRNDNRPEDLAIRTRWLEVESCQLL